MVKKFGFDIESSQMGEIYTHGRANSYYRAFTNVKGGLATTTFTVRKQQKE